MFDHYISSQVYGGWMISLFHFGWLSL